MDKAKLPAVVVEPEPEPEPESAVTVVKPLLPPLLPTPAVPPRAKPGNMISDDTVDHHNALIHLVFDDESWVEVADKDGKSLLAQLNLRGSEKRINGTPPFSLVIGNASVVRLYYQGKRIDLAPYNRAEVAHLTLE